MKKLIFKNGIFLSIFTATFATVSVLVMLCIGFLGEYLITGTAHKYSKTILIVFGCIIAFIWLIFLIYNIFSSKIIVTENDIRAKRFGNIIWSLKREEIILCVYNELHWWYIFIPIAAINAGALQFKMQNYKFSRHYCYLSSKQIDKIRENFSYPFKNIQTIYEQ